MYEDYTRQSLPSRKYRELLGSAVSVFLSNNSFVIENILNNDDNKEYSWYELIDGTSGDLQKPIKRTITKKSNKNIARLFDEIIQSRNRIIHGFRITNESGEQSIATKESKNKNHNQFEITEEYLLEFIKKNEELSDELHNFRGY